MIQPGFFDAPEPVDPGLTCAFGEPWMGEHPLCDAETARQCAQFAEAVARGAFDANGYTQNERKAQAKRLTKVQAMA